METAEAIFKRRSVRKYVPGGKLTDTQIEQLLRAAMAAPTARNTQEWEFLVIQKPEGMDKIISAHPYAMMLKTAAAAIIVCADKNKEFRPGFGVVDGAAAIQNILLAATDMGLGSVWLGMYPVEERMQAINKAFNLPDNVFPVGIVSLGVPDEVPPAADRYDPAKVHYEEW